MPTADDGTSHAAASRWMEAVYEGRGADAWDALDPDLQLFVARNFAWANREHPAYLGTDLEELARALASRDDEHWPILIAGEVDRWRAWWKQDAPLDSLLLATGQRPVALDEEHIVWVPEESVRDFGEGALVEDCVTLLMRRRSGRWLVASPSAHFPMPTWPEGAFPA